MIKISKEKSKKLCLRLENADNKGALYSILKSATTFSRSSFFTIVDIINNIKLGVEFKIDPSIIYLIEKSLDDWESSEQSPPENITLTIKGFEKIEEAQEFCNWYSGQGESDSSIWFDCRVEEGVISSRSMLEQNILQIDKNNIEMNLKMYK